MAVVSLCHQIPDLFGDLREVRVEPSPLAFQLFHPAVGRGLVRLRMPERQRCVPFGRVIAAGYGVQVPRREGSQSSGAVLKRPRPGYLDPFFLAHTKSPCFPSR